MKRGTQPLLLPYTPSLQPVERFSISRPQAEIPRRPRLCSESAGRSGVVYLKARRKIPSTLRSVDILRASMPWVWLAGFVGENGAEIGCKHPAPPCEKVRNRYLGDARGLDWALRLEDALAVGILSCFRKSSRKWAGYRLEFGPYLATLKRSAGANHLVKLGRHLDTPYAHVVERAAFVF